MLARSISYQMSHGSKAPPTCQVKPFLQQSGARLNLPLSYQRLERQPLYCRQRLALRLRWPYHRRSSEGPARESRAARTSDTNPSMRSEGLLLFMNEGMKVYIPSDYFRVDLSILMPVGLISKNSISPGGSKIGQYVAPLDQQCAR